MRQYGSLSQHQCCVFFAGTSSGAVTFSQITFIIMALSMTIRTLCRTVSVLCFFAGTSSDLTVSIMTLIIMAPSMTIRIFSQHHCYVF